MHHRGHGHGRYQGVFSTQQTPGYLAYPGASGFGQETQREEMIPARYVAFGALGLAGLALVIALARG